MGFFGAKILLKYGRKFIDNLYDWKKIVNICELQEQRRFFSKGKTPIYLRICIKYITK